MPACFAFNCRSGYNSSKTHLFRPSKGVSAEWTKILKLRADTVFDGTNKNHVLCHKHFKEEEIIKCDEYIIKGEKVFLPRERWKLKPDCIPTIFNELPKRLQPTKSAPRRELKRSALADTKISSKLQKRNDVLDACSSNPCQQPNETSGANGMQWWESFEENFSGWTILKNEGGFTALKLALIEDRPTIAKSIQLTNKKITSVYVNGVDSTILFIRLNLKEDLSCTEEFSKSLTLLDSLCKCSGIQGYDKVTKCAVGLLENGVWYSKRCEGVIKSNICSSCLLLLPTLQNKFYKIGSMVSKSKTNKTLKPVYLKRKIRRLQNKQKIAKLSIAQVTKQSQTMDYRACSQFIANSHLERNQKEVVLQILNTLQVKSAKGIRYTSQWLLECLLLKIKSPAAYKHLREANLLPLPHPSTIRRVICGEKCSFGFSQSSLQAIKRELNGKSNQDRQGVLSFDEIKLRECLEFNKSSHNFDGYIDYGTDNQDLLESGERKLANSAMVMMYRPLNSNWVQPIAAFSAKDGVKGDLIAKLLLRAIIKLDAVGASVVAVVCDGAQANRKMWRSFGICAKSDVVKNKVEHPCDPSKHLYFLSDVPHLFKCIRNHLLKYKRVKFQGYWVDYTFYEKLYREDNKRFAGLRKCPKLSPSHIWPNNFEKMVVSFATQLFSRSVGTALQFYRENDLPDFRNSEGTEKFTILLNGAFDALNAKIPSEGIRPGSRMYESLEIFYVVVTSELNKAIADKNYVAFASEDTLVGLRITIKSTIDLIDYLVNTLNYKYVLTQKLNQDCLEKFFGLIRGAGGREEHPTIKNFLQLYRLLSLYTPCKRILRGNIRDSSEVSVLCSFVNDLKKTKMALAESKMQFDNNLEETLFRYLERCNQMNNCPELMDHDYAVGYGDGCHKVPNGIDKKIIFHLCGYVALRVGKLLKCDECQETLCKLGSSLAPDEYSHLTDILNRGPLQYPSKVLFRFAVFALEPVLGSLITDKSFYGDAIIECISRLPSMNVDGLGCRSHHRNVIGRIVTFYVTIRYHFYSRSVKKQSSKGKGTKSKRKQSKLVSQ